MLDIDIVLARPGHRYKILLEPGLGGDWRREVERRIESHSYLAVVDTEVARLRNLPGTGTIDGKWRYLWTDGGEQNKNFEQYLALSERALAMEIDRNTVLVAIGGGVTGDLAGFMASTLLRGLRLVQIPTSLLAQVDSSVGGKNGVNCAYGKNLIGTFHQPELVLIDPVFLETLPRREYLAGMAEIVKTSVLDSRDFFEQLKGAADLIVAGNHGFLAGTIGRACRVKADIVSRDERDTGRRAVLNLGHTFGHALEALAGYDGRVIHGEAVAAGLVLAAEFSHGRDLLSERDRDDIIGLVRAVGLPARIADLGRDGPRPVDWKTLMEPNRLAASLLADKKNDHGTITLVLPRAIGECEVVRGNAAAEVARFMIDNLEE